MWHLNTCAYERVVITAFIVVVAKTSFDFASAYILQRVKGRC